MIPSYQSKKAWTITVTHSLFLLVALTNLTLCVFSSTANAQNLLNSPESVVYDPGHDRYLVSNWGDGAIVQIDSNGVQTFFSTALMNVYHLAGLYILGDTLLAAAGDAPNAGIFGFDLETAAVVYLIVLPGVGLPNDITSDRDGIVYVTDYWGDGLYKIENHTPSIYFDAGLDYPNGMLYDDRYHRLLILSVMGTGSPVLAVSLDDSMISTVVTTGLYATDGITMDADYRVYISECTNGEIYQYNSSLTGVPALFSSGHDDPADIYYDRINNVIAVPNLGSNSVDFIPVIRNNGGGTGRIAYCRQPTSAPAVHEIYTINLDGSDNHKISNSVFGVNHHDWSPDGDKLAIVGYEDYPDAWYIYIMDAAGTYLNRITSTTGVWDNEPCWSPDGSRIAFGRLYPNDNLRGEIWMMNADGSDQHWLGVDGDNPTWSPDGSRLVYHSDRSGTFDIYACNSDGTMEQQLTFTPTYNEIAPDWSPSGSQIVYRTDADGNSEIYVMDTDGTNPVRLTNNAVDDFMPTWSPDGSLIAFSSGLPGGDHWEVYVMNADGSNLRRVTYTPSTATAINACWQPFDSSSVAVYLASFSCTQEKDQVKIAWQVSGDSDASDFRLTADKNGRQRTLTIQTSGTRQFESIDSDPGLQTGGSILYQLYAFDEDGIWTSLRSERIVLGTPGLDARLTGVYPNPFNPLTTISFTVDRPLQVRMDIHDASGRQVKTLTNQLYSAGEHQLMWDGRNSAGADVSSGIYLLKFRAGKAVDVRKLVLVR
jgi:Tol biopolymer transport system component